MAKHTRKKPQSVDDRLRCLSPHIDGFKTWLHQNGYREVTITELVRLLACWADWSHTAGFDLDTIQTSFVASAAIFQGGKTARAPRGAGALFIDYLRTQGTLPVLKPLPSAEETWPLLAEFQSWMREQRGVVDSTLDTYRSTLVDLLKALGKDPSAYSASAVRAFVLDRAKPHGRGRAQCIAVATRAFLKFLVATGRCPVGRDHAVPRFANWRLASTPRYLAADGIDRVIDACDGEDRLRDRAIIILLVRLGLRASEVASLTFAQIDWENARLTVAGKTRREERLPLTQEVGEAIIAYVERARPRLSTPRLFVTDIAPIRPLTRIAVKCIARRALDRAGIDSTNRGAHVLRHSAATAMLRHGVSLAGVGAVLRHRSPGMTAHYAKVDIALLSEIAQPWGGSLPC
ncbi:Site-specific integrase/recombinase (plasmid) [Beijerinckiaceae bacterium RH AL1]|nr:tyrosine-type recombinase/integrase [Beijerinckiaceae bacterium]VVB50224.1 Site-specific integrase/recombinase [Beijerinckiaceae bacterium RH CH11]VVB50233.1 Site-specific integrase/recombinase [Beijerinckiaceae bacterium RH AL8]VVC57284.1 Site-specific integrase/recombinase [Beijerinckiaceae bacterium RH AL1]